MGGPGDMGGAGVGVHPAAGGIGEMIQRFRHQAPSAGAVPSSEHAGTIQKIVSVARNF